MKLCRHGEAGHEKPGPVDGSGRLRDLSGRLGEIDAAALAPGALAALAGLDPAALPEVEGRRGWACRGPASPSSSASA